jgi:hypothetical protein
LLDMSPMEITERIILVRECVPGEAASVASTLQFAVNFTPKLTTLEEARELVNCHNSFGNTVQTSMERHTCSSLASLLDTLRDRIKIQTV